MTKQPSILNAYEAVLTESAGKSPLEQPGKLTVGNLAPNQEFFGKKPEKASDCGPEEADLPKSKAGKGAVSQNLDNKPAKAMKAGANMPCTQAPKKEDDGEESEKKQKNEGFMITNAFETLYKKTLAEELDLEETDEESGDDFVADEFEDEEALDTDLEAGEDETDDESSDLVQDLNALRDQIDAILAKIEGDLGEGEDDLTGEDFEDEDFSDEDFSQEFGDDEENLEDEESPVKESANPKQLAASKGKKLMSKSNKVGNIKPKGKKAHTGKAKHEVKPKALGNKGKSLQNPKGKPEVKSTVKKGDFIK